METPTTPRSTLNPPVFYTSAALILALVLFTVLLQEEAQSLFNHVQQWIITNASWFYVLAVALILMRESEINQKGKARKLWDIEEGKGI
ncbi:TPA: BCCT family transporter [Pseudomonas aeruginosa]